MVTNRRQDCLEPETRCYAKWRSTCKPCMYAFMKVNVAVNLPWRRAATSKSSAHAGWASGVKKKVRFLKAGPPWGYWVIFGRRALFFFVSKLLEKNEKWHHCCAHARWWSPWRRKKGQKRALRSVEFYILLIAIDRNGFLRMKEEGQISQLCLRFFNFCPGI